MWSKSGNHSHLVVHSLCKSHFVQGVLSTGENYAEAEALPTNAFRHSEHVFYTHPARLYESDREQQKRFSYLVVFCVWASTPDPVNTSITPLVHTPRAHHLRTPFECTSDLHKDNGSAVVQFNHWRSVNRFLKNAGWNNSSNWSHPVPIGRFVFSSETSFMSLILKPSYFFSV